MLKYFSPIKLISAVLIFMGAACILAGIFFYISTSTFLKQGVVTEAKIVSITSSGSGDSKTHKVLVEYEVDGEKFTNPLGSYSSRMKQGDTLTIRYMPDNPDKIRYAKLELLPFWVLTGTGGVLLTIGFICLYFILKKLFLLNYLKKAGRLIKTFISAVTVHSNHTVNGRPAVSVSCEAAGGESYASEYVYLPEDFFVIGEGVDTYIHPNQDNKYYVDIKKYIKEK